MFQHGLLILTYRPSNVKSLLSKVGSYLKMVNSKISKTLYVSLEPNQYVLGTNQYIPSNDSELIYSRDDLLQIVPAIYVEAHRRAPLLDVRVFHHWHYRHNSINWKSSEKRILQFPLQVIFTNENLSNDFFKNYLNNFNLSDKLEIISLDKEQDHIKRQQQQNSNNFESMISHQTYDYVCLGGTFDNLHNGHKILLSTAQLKCNKSLTIGITNEDMLKNKTLHELIESPEKRLQSLTNYLQDVDPYIEYKLSLISDSFGPAIVDESLQAIVVSEETIKGGHKINEIRSSKGMPQLKIDVIKILEDHHKKDEVEEKKVSSSSLRMRKLGTLLKEPEEKPHLPKKPYLIGLTGIIASGKTAIAKKLEKLGAGVINVDLLAHKTYQSPEAPAYKKLVETFGKEILDQDRNIMRSKLGQIVFNDDSKVKMLNSIIWPEVRLKLKKEVDQMKNRHHVIVLEIALLIESNSMDNVHQIWLTMLDQQEVIQRLKERDHLSEEEAIKRIEAMIPTRKKMKYANVVFCTQWDEQFTWEQVQRAWKMLNDKFVDSEK